MIEMRATFVKKPTLSFKPIPWDSATCADNDNTDRRLPAGRILRGMGGLIEEDFSTEMDNFPYVN